MKELFKVKIKIQKEEIELFFDNQDRAERFINATTEIMTSKGKKSVEFTPEIVSVIDCDEDVLESYSSAMGNL
tara:strand:+ start:3074 stop:3292 length:219 start_codon:yes stop_codon:yes gene_type:complete